MEMPIRYAATIETLGQCRDNLKTWRGIWRLGLSCQPRWDEEENDNKSCYAVLTHRKSCKSTRETRFFGNARLTHLCGDMTYLDIQWQFWKELVPWELDLGTKSSEIDAKLWEAELYTNNQNSSGRDNELESTVANSVFLYRGTYLLMGNPGVNENDHCIRLSLIDGYNLIGAN